MPKTQEIIERGVASDVSICEAVYTSAPTMHLSLEQHLPAIQSLCAECRVRRLELFGSAASGEFDPQTSDVDFFVEFDDLGWQGSFKRYMRLKLGLEDLLGRPVDLVELDAVENRHFLLVANRHRSPIYAA